ncbi:MAG: hypothetical protein IKT29_06190 [Flavobacteriales bacterium]|nr:hypothetical protein [Flavobacteriales bacterium]
MKDKVFLYVWVAALMVCVSCSKVDDAPLPDDGGEDYVIKRDSPENEGVRVAYKKAHQFTDIKWSPKNYLPSTKSDKGYSPSSEYKGLWYSSVKETNKYVGIEVSLKTVMTALHNPYSLLYTENISEERSRSAYGEEYHGTNCGAYMGIVCSSLVAYALGFDLVWTTATFPYLAEKGIFKKINGNNVQNLKLMDVLHEDGHGSLITDIWRDGQGRIVKIEITESISPTAVSRIYTAEEAQKRFNKDDFKAFYRYQQFYKNTEYKASAFVALEGETAGEYKYNDDICTFAGDYASFGGEERIVINYTKGGYTHMEIHGESGLLHTLDLAVSADEHNMDITHLGLDGGYYKARLVGDGKSSDYTYFSVVDYDIKTSGVKTALTVDFSSVGGEAKHIKVTRDHSYLVCFYSFTTVDKNAGRVKIDIEKIRPIKRNDPNEELYLQVAFTTRYGIVHSRPIKIQ